jgi:glycosyltransferase involved in cell wall biosynthesis
LTRAHRHDLYDYANYPKFCPFQDYIINNIDHVVTISKDGENYLKARYDSQSKKITTFRLGVSPGAITEPSNDGVFRIVSCSALKPVKRVQYIAQALQFIDFPIEWIHIGDGPDREKIKSIIEKILSIKQNVSVKLLGSMPNHEVLNFYGTHPVDLFINVSSSEGIPVSIMEAISRGIPSIATDVGGTSELINPKLGGGWLLPPKVSPEEIAKLMIKIRNLKLHITEREKTFSLWKNRFDARVNFSIFAKWLTNLQGSRNSEGMGSE